MDNLYRRTSRCQATAMMTIQVIELLEKPSRAVRVIRRSEQRFPAFRRASLETRCLARSQANNVYALEYDPVQRRVDSLRRWTGSISSSVCLHIHSHLLGRTSKMESCPVDQSRSGSNRGRGKWHSRRRELGGIRCIGVTLKKMKRLSSEADTRHIVFTI